MHDNSFLSVLARKLEEWFKKHGRRYPWREMRDPFAILLTEFLLQRTKAETVARIFDTIITRYKKPQNLALASIDELKEVFSKIGLLYRAERLKEIAQELVKKYGGRVPNTMEELLLLKGVGVYIASAVLNFGYGVPTPVVDKNVMRVCNRLLGITSESSCRDFISKLYNYGDHVVLAYALIDLGAMICTEQPLCRICPINEFCGKHPLMKDKWRMLRKIIVDGKVRLQEQPVD